MPLAPPVPPSDARPGPLARRQILLTALAAAAWPAVQAQTPGRPLRLVVPFTPGGTTDILARALGPKLGTALGQNVVIENKPGAGGSLGAGEVAKADADGNTLLMGHIGTLAVNPAIYPRLPYDPLKSFAPVAWVARVPNVLVVPYRGTPAVLTALRAGEIDVAFEIVGPMLAQVSAGVVRTLAVSSERRNPALPEVPTVQQVGVAGYNVASWNALAAPAGTPADVIDKLGRAARDAVVSAAVRGRLESLGMRLQGSTPAELQALLTTEIKRWGDVLRAARIEPE